MAAPPRRGGGRPGREHRLEPGDTLAGLALRYGVTMEQIKRANRLYSDTIFLRPTLLIPAQLGAEEDEEEEEEEEEGASGGACPAPSRHELSAGDFLQRLDAEIRLSTAAAARRLRQGRAGDAEAEGAPVTAAGARAAPPRGALLGPRPLTRTPRAAALRDAEDEIFTL